MATEVPQICREVALARGPNYLWSLSHIYTASMGKDFKRTEKVGDWYDGLDEVTKSSLTLLQRYFLEQFGKKALRKFLEPTERG